VASEERAQPPDSVISETRPGKGGRFIHPLAAAPAGAEMRRCGIPAAARFALAAGYPLSRLRRNAEARFANP